MPRDEDRVADILASAGFIRSWVEGKSKKSLQDRLLLSALARELAIIGEACNRLSSEFKEQLPDVEWRDIVQMRNILIHAYNRVDPDIVWEAATVDVPILVDALTALVERAADGDVADA